MESAILPLSAIIPTANRLAVLMRTLQSVADQSHVPAEIIIIDASELDYSKQIADFDAGKIDVIYRKAVEHGAASQRLQGIAISRHNMIWFLDDDIILEKDCTIRLWNGFEFRPEAGAVNAMIVNQRYTDPGFVSRTMFRIMNGKKLDTYAGKVIGPGWNLLPEDKEGLPEYVECEWLNTTCTIYRKAAFPQPVFSDFFQGYSMLEDATLSITIGRTYKLLNARTARIFHDSQSGSHKNNVMILSKMELVNRHYLMTRVLNRKGIKSYAKLFVFELFGIVTGLRSSTALKVLPKVLQGKINAIIKIAKGK